MRIQLFCCATFMAILMVISDCFADKAVIMDGTWVIISDGNSTLLNNRNVQQSIVEKRYGMSMAEIEKKFEAREKLIKSVQKRIKKLKEKLSGGNLVPSSLTDKISTAEGKITALQDNQSTIKDSIASKCKQLDRLFEPDEHCCVTDFCMICVPDALVNGVNPDFAFPSDHAAGECPECPEKLKDIFATDSRKYKK